MTLFSLSQYKDYKTLQDAQWVQMEKKSDNVKCQLKCQLDFYVIYP